MNFKQLAWLLAPPSGSRRHKIWTEICQTDGHLSDGHLSDGNLSDGHFWPTWKNQCTLKIFFVPAPITLEIIFEPSLYHGESVDISRFEIGPKMWTGRSIRHTHTDRQAALLFGYKKQPLNLYSVLKKKTLIKKPKNLMYLSTTDCVRIFDTWFDSQFIIRIRGMF